MIIKIEMTGEIPIYQQIRNQIVFGVVSGRLKSGEKLPTIRQLADDIGVNPMTVNKAYALIKESGVIVIDRRHGAQINHIQTVKDPMDQQFEHHAERLIAEVLLRGARQDELKKYICRIIDKMYEESE